jgi:uncharacterized membrane protein
MTLLVLGLALWVLAHLAKRLVVRGAEPMPKSTKGIMAAAILAGVLLMIIGFRQAPVWPVYVFPPWAVHLNNLMVLVAFYLFAAAGAKTAVARRMRHPQLTGFSLWAAAHLLVNGDLASIVLFGTLLVWALVEMVVINSAEPVWTPPPPASRSKEIRAAVGAIVLFGLVAGIHTWLGYYPFG